MNIERLKILKDNSVKDALTVIENGGLKIAFVVDENNILLGTIGDGDIRRGFLKGRGVDSPILDLYNNSPIVANISSSEVDLKRISIESVDQVDVIPLINDRGKLIDVYCRNNEILSKNYDNTVVLMVGGMGKRLRPLTKDMPKPLLNVGGKPILQTIVEGFAKHGFTNITMCLGYKSNLIQNFFKDGKEFGINIDYIVEEKEMGTGGALSLIKKEFNEPLFVMNGDLLTNIDYGKVIDFHKNNNSKATMCVSKYDIKVPYGVININNEEITSVQEKPIHSFFVNAGIYLIEPECIDIIPKGEFYDMPTLFERLIENNEKIISFPLNEYWIDIGRLEDFKTANNVYPTIF